MLNTVSRIGPVLDLFTPERPEWRVTDIAEAIGISKSSTHALVATLVDIGLLSSSSQRRYRLGWKLLTLGERMRATLDFREHALPEMQHLAGELRETVLLSVLDRHQVLYVERVEGTHPTVRLAGVRVGARWNAHATAAGKVLLADRRVDEVRRILPDELSPTTQKTTTSIDALLEELVKVRAVGVALDLGEAVPDVSCVSAPVYDRYGSAVAAMSVSVPAYRFERRRTVIKDKLLEAAASVSSNLARADRRVVDPERDEEAALAP